MKRKDTSQIDIVTALKLIQSQRSNEARIVKAGIAEIVRLRAALRLANDRVAKMEEERQ